MSEHETHELNHRSKEYSAAAEYSVKRSELPISCPTKDMPLWSMHPRVFLPLDEDHREHICPYCDAKFTLID